MKNQNKLFLILIVIATSVGCDQLSKDIARETLKYAPPKSYFGNSVRLQYAENSGAFLSLGSGLSETTRTYLFTFVSGGLLVGLLLYMLINRQFSRRQVVALSLILGGGCGNLIDRIFNDGHVVDFMNIGIGSLRTGIFNIADVLIMTGMGLVILFSYRERPKPPINTLDQSGGEKNPK
jgi:signal peptidase II